MGLLFVLESRTSSMTWMTENLRRHHQKTAVSHHIACCCCRLYEHSVCSLGAGMLGVEWGVVVVVVIVRVSKLAEGQDPLVQLQCVGRLTELQQSQDAAWDIDRLEPEGSCRIGTHCQRLCDYHRLSACKGRKGI